MKREPEVSFLTFGGGRPGHRRRRGYHRAVRRICREAAEFNLFNQIIGYTDEDFRRDFPGFCARHGDFIETRPGYGYYLWKPFLIHHHLQAMRDGDLLLFVDAGCELNLYGKPRLMEYFALCAEHFVLTFRLSPACTVEAWTKMDTLLRLDPERRWAERPQHESGRIFITKTARTMALAEEWLAVCMEDNYRYLTPWDRPSPPPQNFREHRYEQAILTLLLFKHGLDFSLPTDVEGSIQARYPICTSRNRSGVTSLTMVRLQIAEANSFSRKALLWLEYVRVQFIIRVLRKTKQLLGR